MNKCRLYGELWKGLLPYVKEFRNYGFEVGFSVCRDGETLKLNNIGSVGLGASLVIACQDSDTEANIHSHINSSKASLQDHLTALSNRIPVSCITYSKNGEEYIRCYKYYGDEEQRNKDIQLILKLADDEKAHAKLTDELDNKYFLCEEKI